MIVSQAAKNRLQLILKMTEGFDLFGDEGTFLAYYEGVKKDRAKGPYSFPYLEDKSRFNVTKEQTRAGNVFYRMLPLGGQAANPVTILYFHGGGWIGEMNEATWIFCQQFCDKEGMQVIATDYPLAPQYTYKEAFAYAVDVYGELLEGIPPENIAFSGDSAGGYMALATAQLALMEGLPQPRAIIPLSPSFDMTSGPSERKDLEKLDPMLGTAAFKHIPGIWAPDIEDCAAFPPSPLYGPLEGLAPIHLIGGELEMLRQDSLDLQERAASLGIQVTYSMYPGMWHCFFTHVDLPEAQEAFQEIVHHIQQP